MTSTLIFSPPFIKYVSGPLAGPALLAGVGREVGVDVQVVDVNIRHLRQYVTARAWPRPTVVGDHTPDPEGIKKAKSVIREVVLGALDSHLTSMPPVGCDVVDAVCLDHDQVQIAAHALADSSLVDQWMTWLPTNRPMFVGVSVMTSGQVLPGLALSLACKRRWPGICVVWGGAHVTAIADAIAGDVRFGWCVDGFVAGYAERTFRAMLLAGNPLAVAGVFEAGSGRVVRAIDGVVEPDFGDLSLYGSPHLTLPMQTSRGCAYGRCAFCTYHAVEGRYRTTPLEASASTIELASRLGADLAVKDALLTADRMDAVGALIDGRCRWAATTRITPRLGRQRLERLTAQGLRTLEFGVESLDPATLGMIDKKQRLNDLEVLLEDAAGLELHLVLNVMFGFPGQTFEDANATCAMLEETFPMRYPHTHFSTERNLLQLETLSPMGRDPDRYGVRIHERWPWASVMSWNTPTWCQGATETFTGHHIRRAA